MPARVVPRVFRSCRHNPQKSERPDAARACRWLGSRDPGWLLVQSRGGLPIGQSRFVRAFASRQQRGLSRRSCSRGVEPAGTGFVLQTTVASILEGILLVPRTRYIAVISLVSFIWSTDVSRILVLALMVTFQASSAEPPKEFTNSIGMPFKLIPAGEFLMGSSKSPEELAKTIPGATSEWFEDEHPQHKVRITKPFYMGVTEVTQGQYEKVMGKNPSGFSRTGIGADQVKGMDTSTFPVEYVSWDDAVEFCKKLSAMEGQTYRLPTEAEWEYCCRAGGTTRYCFGDDDSQLDECAWFHNNFGNTTHPVGQKKPNAWGLYDMHGNAFEWTSNWYGNDYDAKSTEDDPTGPSTGSVRVYRGGCWYFNAWFCRSSYRGGYPPSPRIRYLGFRVARVPSGNSS